jgi:hypothetical protein
VEGGTVGKRSGLRSGLLRSGLLRSGLREHETTVGRMGISRGP